MIGIIPTLETVLTRLAQASVYGGVLILIVLALRAALGRWLRPRWVFALWIVVLLRLALPISPAASFSLFSIARAAPDSIAPIVNPGASVPRPRTPAPSAPLAGGESPSEAAPVAPGPIAAAAMPSTAQLLVMLWAAGAAALATAVLIGQARLRRMAAAARQVCDRPVVDLMEECKARIGLRTPVTIAECPGVSSPLLMGMIRPVLLIPPGLTARLSEAELRSVIMHELAHVRRSDIAIGWCATLVLVVHWFNPLVWLAVARMKADRELACDALVLSWLRQQERPAYGRTLITLLEHAARTRTIPGLAAIAENSGDIKRRIAMVARFRPARRSAAVLPAAFVALVACVTLTDGQPVADPTPPVAVGPAPADLTGEGVLKSIAEVYSKAKTYQDEGVVTTKFVGTPVAHTRHLPFSTAFASPDRLRYEFNEGSKRYVVWSDGKKIRSWWSIRPMVQEFPSFDLALAGPTGISGGSATAITTLLIPGQNWGTWINTLGNPKLVAVEAIDGVPCLKIDGDYAGSPMTVWADAKSYLVRRTFLKMEVKPDELPGAVAGEPFTTETTITIKPRLNEEIPAKRFEFDPKK